MISHSPALLALLLWTLPARAEDAPPPPAGTGRLQLGAHVGAILPFSTQGLKPAFGVHVAGPLGSTGPRFGLEWLATLDPWYRDGDSSQTFVTGITHTTTGGSIFLVALPGLRALFPVRPRFLIHADVSLGPAMQRTWGRSQSNGESRSLDDFYVFAAWRVAAGALIPFDERLRLTVTPFALQNYVHGQELRGVSVQLGLEYALY